MIAPEVAWDKLCSFQTADELRDYFVGEGVKGVRASARTCPIAVWMTGQTAKTTTVAAHVEVDRVEFGHTAATYAFMYNFDRTSYPELDAVIE